MTGRLTRPDPIHARLLLKALGVHRQAERGEPLLIPRHRFLIRVAGRRVEAAARSEQRAGRRTGPCTVILLTVFALRSPSRGRLDPPGELLPALSCSPKLQ